jgi:ADP-ribose pyrophosphatase
LYIFEGDLLKLKKEENYEIVEHPGACAIIIHYKENNNEEKICLVKQYRKPIEKFLWEIPAGKIDSQDPNLIETIKRETLEETGIIINENKIKYLGYIYTTPGFSNEVIHIFYYLLDSFDNISLKQMDSNEIDDIKLFNIKEIKEMILKNEITDTKTLSAFTFANIHNLIKF